MTSPKVTTLEQIRGFALHLSQGATNEELGLIRPTPDDPSFQRELKDEASGGNSSDEHMTALKQLERLARDRARTRQEDKDRSKSISNYAGGGFVGSALLGIATGGIGVTVGLVLILCGGTSLGVGHMATTSLAEEAGKLDDIAKVASELEAELRKRP